MRAEGLPGDGRPPYDGAMRRPARILSSGAVVLGAFALPLLGPEFLGPDFLGLRGERASRPSRSTAPRAGPRTSR